MKNENNELIITTGDAFEVIRIINKLDMKEGITNAIEEFVKINNKKEDNILELRKLLIEKVGGNEEYLGLTEEDKEKNAELILLENEKLNEKMKKVKSDLSRLGGDLIYDFIIKLPMGEKEIYKCLAKIFNKTIAEVEGQQLDETLNQIKSIAGSKSLLGFFNLATK